MKFEHVVCPFCGCVCDDGEIEVDNGKITRVRNLCAIGKNLFLNSGRDLSKPTVMGKNVTIEKAIDEAVEILSKAEYPLIYGLSCVECDAQRKAVELAEVLRGVIDTTSSVCHGPTTLALQSAGEIACSLGMAKNHADLVVFWGCNPVEAHPRHLARYSVSAKGLFTPNGRKDRKVVVVDVRETRTAKLADRFIMLKPGTDFEVFLALRSLIKGKSISNEEELPAKELKDLAEAMKSCRYGIIFFGQGLTMTHGKHMNVDAALELVRDLNAFTRFAIMPMREHSNVTGADNVLTRQTGYPYAIDFSLGYPRFMPGEYSAVDLLSGKEVDAALIIGADPASSFPRGAAEQLADINTIVIDPNRSITSEIAKVVIPAAKSGISCEGTVYRMDEVPLRLKKVIDSPYPSDAEILGKIIEEIRAREREKCSG